MMITALSIHHHGFPYYLKDPLVIQGQILSCRAAQISYNHYMIHLTIYPFHLSQKCHHQQLRCSQCPQLPCSQCPQLPCSQFRQLRTMQSIPAVTMQSIPAVTMQSIPAVTMQSIPAVTMQSIPAVTMQSIPAVTMQSIPAVTMQSIPAVTVQSIPAVTVQLIPAVTVQSIPAVTMQLIPAVTMQSIPAVTMQSIPAVTMQSIPTVTMQSIPAVTMQLIPAVTMQSTEVYPSPINPMPVPSLPQQAQLSSPTQPPPPPFNTPPKLRAVQEVMRDYPGTDVNSLRRLATGIAREAIFGKKELQQSSLSGKNRIGSLDKTKLDYIKNVVKSRVPNISLIEFEFVWKMCRTSISKSCQTLRIGAKRKL